MQGKKAAPRAKLRKLCAGEQCITGYGLKIAASTSVDRRK